MDDLPETLMLGRSAALRQDYSALEQATIWGVNLHYDTRALLLIVSLLVALSASAQPAAPSEPYVGQPGKDVIWVPTPPTWSKRCSTWRR